MKKADSQTTFSATHFGSIIKNILITLILTIAATVAAFWFFRHVPENPSNIALVYITALVLTARFTTGYAYGIFASLGGVICVNYLFTYPYFAFNFTLTGYPITFLFMLIISPSISTMTSQIKTQGKVLVEREKLLMEAEKEKMRANLLRSVSHDLRTPLTGIIGNSSTYIDNYDTLSEKEKLNIVSHIKDDSNWLLCMVENLLSVTRIDERSMGIATSLESVEEVAAEAIQRLQKRLPNADIHVQVPEEYLLIPMDAMLIEQVIINLLENALNQNYKITTASSGTEGLHLCASLCPDVVLLDLGLPDIDGMEVIKRLRTWTSTPIIVISARSYEQEKAKALYYGADDYITKPFSTVELLAQNSGKVLTYSFIMEKIWGPYVDNNNQILRVNMANIRRKIEKNPAVPEHVFTEIGIGYRMAEGN